VEEKWKIYSAGLGIIAEMDSVDPCSPIGPYEVLAGFPCAGEIINIY